jgi:hypothetical protein
MPTWHKLPLLLLGYKGWMLLKRKGPECFMHKFLLLEEFQGADNLVARVGVEKLY